MTLIVVVAYRDHLEPVASVAACTGTCIQTVDKMWRIVLAFGGVPGWFALYYRLTIPGKHLQSPCSRSADKRRNAEVYL
jgi:PHS family inorganic phosphate transporter-like MFS transporter